MRHLHFAAISLRREDERQMRQLAEGDQTLESGADGGPSAPDIRRERVDDVRAAALARDHARIAEHLEVVADRRLADGAALGEVAGTHRVVAGNELPDDGEADGIGQRLEESDVVVHAVADYIDLDRY